MLLIGTDEGIYRASMDAIDDATRVLASESVHRLHRSGDAVLAATGSGLVRSLDRGDTWEDLAVPRREVRSVRRRPHNGSLYAGTHPAHLYVSPDDGTWHELEGLQALPSRAEWRLPRHRNEAHVRAIGAHPDAPDRIVVGIEVGGVHVSEDGGATWNERREGLHDDVHHLLVLGPETYVASCGGGLYRTRTAGHSWTRLDGAFDHVYFREAIAAGGRLYAAAARSPPPTWSGERGPDAALFESTDGGDSFETVPYPGMPEEFVLAWTVLADGTTVVAGTTDGGLIRRTGGEWRAVGHLGARIRSLAAI